MLPIRIERANFYFEKDEYSMHYNAYGLMILDAAVVTRTFEEKKFCMEFCEFSIFFCKFIWKNIFFWKWQSHFVFLSWSTYTKTFFHRNESLLLCFFTKQSYKKLFFLEITISQKRQPHFVFVRWTVLQKNFFMKSAVSYCVFQLEVTKKSPFAQKGHTHFGCLNSPILRKVFTFELHSHMLFFNWAAVLQFFHRNNTLISGY